MIAKIFTGVSSVITGMTGALVSSFSGIVGIFYDSNATTPGLTEIGELMLIPFGVGLVYGAYKLIKRLFRVRG